MAGRFPSGPPGSFVSTRVLAATFERLIDEGGFRCGGTELIVGRGLGVVGLPLRIGCAPQAVLLELARG